MPFEIGPARSGGWPQGVGSLFAIALACGAAVLTGPARAAPPDDEIRLEPGPRLRERAQEALIRAKPGATLVFPEGRFQLDDELIVGKYHIRLRGQGMNRTVLSFKGQPFGAQGILATADAFTIEDLAVEDTRGDAIRVEGANHVVFRRVRVEWTRGPSEANGAYGIYPVQCRNVLVEDSVVRGASDAGIYVGQSSQIVVRRNLVESNVAGIEIENSRYADVYANEVRRNTGGILVFDLPNLKVQGGRQTRVFDNHVHRNNTRNFAPKGNIVGIVPGGTGMMVMANDDIEIFGNRIHGHRTASLGIINYRAAQLPITDPRYDPVPQRIHVHDNVMEKPRWTLPAANQFSFLIHMLFGFRVPDVVYDGIGDGTYSGKPFPPELRICLRNNRSDVREHAPRQSAHAKPAAGRPGLARPGPARLRA